MWFLLALVLVGGSLPILLISSLAHGPRPPAGKAPLELLIEGFRAPTGVAVGPDGTLFFTDEKEGSLLQRDPDGIVSLLEDRLKRPRGLVRAGDGTLFLVAEGLRGHRGKSWPKGLLLKRSPGGTLAILASGFNRPQELTVHHDGQPLLSTQGGLQRPAAAENESEEQKEGKENDEGSESRPPGFPGTLFRVNPAPGQIFDAYPGFRRPSGLWIDEGGILTVAAQGFKKDGPPLSGSLFQIDPAGRVTLILAERFKGPAGLVRDALGQFYLAVKGEERGQDEDKDDEWAPEGGLLLKVGPDGTFTYFAEGFEWPWGLALDAQGNLYVSDPTAGRIYRFLAPPPPTLAPLPAATNKPQITLSGTTEPGARITVRGGQEEVRTLTNAEGTFALGVPLTLDRPNGLAIYATGARGEGLTGAPAIASIVQDSTPPTVAFLRPAPGSRLAEGVPVEITAEDTGSGLAAVDFLVDGALQGSRPEPPFTFALDTAPFAPGPHTLTARAVDQAGNAARTTLPVDFGPLLGLTITAPAEGAPVPTDSLLVRGTVEAGRAEVGVTVNGFLAAVQGETFAALIRVTPQTTALTAVATTAAGATASHSVAITVSATPAPTMVLHASPASGVAPLTVAFSLLGAPAAFTIELDFEGNGTVNFTGPSVEGQTFTYAAPGLYLPTVIITDPQGNHITASAVVQVYDPIALDALLQSKWQGIKAALQLGDIPAALQFIASQSRSIYQELFAELDPVVSIVGANLGDVRIVEIREDLAEGELLVLEDGRSISYYVEFIRDTDGLWRLNFL